MAVVSGITRPKVAIPIGLGSDGRTLEVSTSADRRFGLYILCRCSGPARLAFREHTIVRRFGRTRIAMVRYWEAASGEQSTKNKRTV